MSHHEDEETQMALSPIDNNATHHRHAHSHIHLNPIAALDHIKSKVKRRRASTKSSLEQPDVVSYHNTRRASQDNNLIEPTITLPTTRSHSSVASQVLSDHYSNTADEKETNLGKNLLVRKDGIISDDNDNKETVQWQLGETELDNDNNQKNTKSKNKLNKISKFPPESNNQSYTKKPRQTSRRTGFHVCDEDFNNIFNELPSDEKLIVACSCAWRRDLSLYGRIFLSVNYLCFYTAFFKREESLCIPYKDIISVTKEKSARLVPNAIKIRTNNREQYVFVSNTSRERLYIAIFRLWQNVLLDKPLDYQQLKATVYADQITLDESTDDSEGSVEIENNGEQSSNNSLTSHSLPRVASNGLKESSPESKISDQKMISSSADKDQTNHVSACPCETHLVRTLADRQFYYDVDTLFELTYGNNSFTRAFHDAQKLLDYNSTEWQMNNETGKRERQVTYRTVTQSILGTNTISCSEKQVIEVEKPHSMYVISSEVHNEGMKYTDAFLIATRFCMFQRDAEHSSLRITAEIKYLKSVNAIAKAFIDKNANSSIEECVANQIRRLECHQASVCNRTSGQKQLSPCEQGKRKKRHHSKNPGDQNNGSAINSDISYRKLPHEKSITGKGFWFDIALFIGILLLLLHIYLCYKLYSIDQALNTPDFICISQCRQGHLKNKLHH